MTSYTAGFLVICLVAGLMGYLWGRQDGYQKGIDEGIRREKDRAGT